MVNEKKESPKQSSKFIAVARAAECDENETVFEVKLKRIAKGKHKSSKKEANRGKSR